MLYEYRMSKKEIQIARSGPARDFYVEKFNIRVTKKGSKW